MLGTVAEWWGAPPLIGMARVRFSPVPPMKTLCRRRLVARIADLQSADGSSILLAGTMCPVRPMDQDRTLRTFRFGFESRAGYQTLRSGGRAAKAPHYL